MDNKGKKEELRHEDLGDTKDSVNFNDLELSERINRLYGKEGSPNNYKEQKEYSPEEILVVRKKLMLLLTVVVLGGLIMIIIFINPFESNNYQKEDKVEENIGSEEDEEVQLGVIPLTDDLVVTLNNYVSFYTNDLVFVDLTQLYAKESLEFEDFPNDIKLFLLQKNNGVKDMLDAADANEYFSTCDNDGMIIEKGKFDDLVSKVYGPGIVLEYTDFNFLYYRGLDNNVDLTFYYEKEKEQYVVKCNDFGENFNFDRIIQQELVKAERTENAIELYQYVVFINQNGVYKDFAMKELITKDLLTQKTDYISKGSVYKYTFAQDGNNFYLSRIDLV